MQNKIDVSQPVAIGADHAGYEYKKAIIDWLENNNYKIIDFGTHSSDSVDFPDFAHPVASAVESGKAGCGILICGSANGVAITANKHQGVRAALCWRVDIAELARQHNNANIICLPSRFTALSDCQNMVNAFMKTAFEGGRHEERVKKIGCSG